MTNTISPNKPLRSATRVQMITLVGVFAAISTILMFIEMPIPFMPPFLKVDLSGVPILIMGFMYGPLLLSMSPLSRMPSTCCPARLVVSVNLQT